MAVEVEIVERSSVIVVTLTGGTDIGALEPLHDALQVAASEGKTVVLDITELARACPLTGIIDVLGPAAATLKIVAHPSAAATDPPVGYTEVYTSVDAAIGAARSANSEPSDGDLVAKFDDLRTRYEQMINTCRQLLDSAESHGTDYGRSSCGS
jgi:hypothetical protein